MKAHPLPTRPVVAALVALAVVLGVGLGASPEAEAIGLLIPSEPQLPPLAVQSHRVTIDVTDRASVTRVEQVFVNHTPRQLEATFVFAVPPGSTVSDFSLWINGVKTKGTVLEKDKARAIYEGIVRRAQDPGLVEYMDGTLFQARIFPVPANGTQKVEIAYASVLPQSGNLRHLLYPLKTGRRAARLMKDFTLVANLSSKAPLKAIYSPSHKIHVARKGDHKATVSFEKDAVDLEQDFQLYVGTGQDDVGLSLLTYDKDGSGGGDGYFSMVLSPKVDIDESNIPPKSVTFVVDTSGSMIGDKMEQARAALAYCVQKLRPIDHFDIVRFSTDVESLFGRPMPATKARVSQGVRFAKELEAAGGTAIDDALAEALSAKAPDGHPHFVLFLTDGRPTVGNTAVAEILDHARRNNRANARIFSFGVGYDVNTVLLDQLAEQHGADPEYIRPGEDIELKVTDLYNKIAFPVLSDLQLDYGARGVYDVYPRRLPDLFKDGQITVMGRYRAQLPPTIKLTGNLQGRGIAFEFQETEAAGKANDAHDFIPKLWATRKIGYLLSEIQGKGELAELKDEVIRLARKFGLVTPYTSYLAVDDSELDNDNNRRPPTPPRPWNPGPRPVDQAVPRGGGGGEGRDASGFGMGAKDAPQAAPPAEAERYRREEALLGGDKADTGKKAVEKSIATEELKRVDNISEATGLRTRHIDGQLFVFSAGVWRQDGASDKGAVTVKYMSKAWFALLAARPELRDRLSLGERVLLKVGKKTVLVGPEGKESLNEAEVKRW